MTQKATTLYYLNFYLLRWIGYRLARVLGQNDKQAGWRWVYWPDRQWDSKPGKQ